MVHMVSVRPRRSNNQRWKVGRRGGLVTLWGDAKEFASIAEAREAVRKMFPPLYNFRILIVSR